MELMNVLINIKSIFVKYMQGFDPWGVFKHAAEHIHVHVTIHIDQKKLNIDSKLLSTLFQTV